MEASDAASGKRKSVSCKRCFQHSADREGRYSTFPIREQAKRCTEWDFRLSHIYTVALLNFDMREEAFAPEKIQHHVKLCDTDTHRVFYGKLEFIYVEIAKFNKTEDELETLYDKWLYVLKNLSSLEKRPKALRERIFDRLFEEAEIARFTPQELHEYEDSRKAYRDLKNSLDTALRDGIKQGREEGLKEGMKKGMKEGLKKGMKKGLAETARRLKVMSMGVDDIQKATGLSADDIEALIRNYE